MPLLRDAADTSLRRAHPSLMIGDGGPSPGRLPVWLINISAAHHYHHHCCFPVTQISRFMLAVRGESPPAEQQKVYDAKISQKVKRYTGFCLIPRGNTRF